MQFLQPRGSLSAYRRRLGRSTTFWLGPAQLHLSTNTSCATTHASSLRLCIHAYTATKLRVATRCSFTCHCRLVRQSVSRARTPSSFTWEQAQRGNPRPTHHTAKQISSLRLSDRTLRNAFPSTMASVQQQVNGNGAAVKPTRAEHEGSKENIFLFIPNLIGMATLPHHCCSPAN